VGDGKRCGQTLKRKRQDQKRSEIDGGKYPATTKRVPGTNQRGEKKNETLARKRRGNKGKVLKMSSKREKKTKKRRSNGRV